MSVNIIDMVKSQLGGAAVNKLSSFLGESSENTQSALGATIPTLLAGLTHAASTPEGAQKLSDAAAEHENALSNYGDSISSQGESIASKGSSALSSLLGGGMSSGIASVLGRFTGLSGSTTSRLIGLATPLLFGILGKYQRSTGLNATGLSGFLSSQKQNITGAMPAGLSSMLGSIPGLSGFAKTEAPEVGATEKTAYERPTYDTSRKVEAEPVGASGKKWGIGVAAALAALGLVWAVSNHRRAEEPRVAQTTPMITEPAGSQTPQVSSLKSGLNETLSSVNTTLNGITDPASADKAMPELNQLNGKLTDLHSSWDTLPDAVKSTAASPIQSMSGTINDSIAKVRAMPGVGDKLKPVLDELDKNLSGFNMASPAPTPAP